MKKELIEKLKAQLESEKSQIQQELASFAKEDKTLKYNWNTKRPETDNADMEEAAETTQEYDNLLSLEYSLELKLKDVDIALEKIAAGKYGVCEKCGKEIEEERLVAFPEARLCMRCNSQA
jgi:DnaK suppressor protein